MSAASSSLRTLLALVGVVGALGCECFFDPTAPQCTVEEDAGPDPRACDNGGCAVTSPGCEGADVERVRDQTCATCASTEGDVLICGAPTTAECELRYDARGEECRYCPTDNGEVLYDDCFSTGAIEDLACEPAPLGPDDPVAPDMSCTVCRDNSGNVVENRCEPVSDECHEETQGDAVCRICTREGQVVVQECQGSGSGGLAPDFCEVYENAAGRCVDCWNNDVLLSHRCSTATAPVTCVENVTVDGLWCLTCVDSNGVVVDQSCNPDVTDPGWCQVLEYSEQTCVVCLDGGGAITSTSCERNECAGANECPPPPPCSFEYAEDGQLCRACPTDAGELETRCLGDAALYCEELVDPTQRCTVCYDVDSGFEVYRDCGGAPPPTCEVVVEPGSTSECEVCYDPATGLPIYSSCDGQTCSYLGGFALSGVNGEPLTVENRPAVADCGQCAEAAGTNEGVSLSCTLLHDCDDGTQSFVDSVCPTSVLFDLAPLACGNPWDEAGYPSAPGTLDELLAVLSFALEQHQLALVSVNHLGASDTATCDGCDCVRSDGLRVEVRAEDAARVVSAFEPVLDRCESELDCGGGLCRMDGACSPP